MLSAGNSPAILLAGYFRSFLSPHESHGCPSLPVSCPLMLQTQVRL